jgi:hypothetical protein
VKRLLFRDKRNELEVTQRALEIALELPSGSLSAIEKGKLPVEDSYFDGVLFPALERLAGRPIDSAVSLEAIERVVA